MKNQRPEDILAEENGTRTSEDDWTLNLEDMIQEQTMKEQREQEQAHYGRLHYEGGYEEEQGERSKRGRRNNTRNEQVRYSDEEEDMEELQELMDAEAIDSEDEDSILFEETEEPKRTGGRGSRRQNSELSRKEERERSQEMNRGYRGEQSRRRSAESERYDEYSDRRERERGMSRKERKEYEEFLAYKEEMERGRGKKKKKHRVRRTILFLLVLLLIVVPVLTIMLRMSGVMQGISTADIKDLISDEVKKSQETGAMAGYTNIALFGLDSTQESLDSGNNRTDVMIIASINNKSGDVKLVSIYRDTYLDIGDGNYQKANAAYAYGGPEQAIKMLNTNLDLNITDYVTIGFAGVADMIDSVGGIEIDVQQDEIEHLNNYQSTMATELGKEYVPVTSAGTQTLTGLQATAYCRIRYTDGGDFKRTERQKEVLSKTFEKLKKSGPITMIKAANSLSSEVRTSLNAAEIASLALKAMRLNIADTSGFPNESLRAVGYIGDQSCVIPIHLSDNVVWLHQYLFGDDSYQVSQTVQSISDTVSAKSGY